MFVAVPNVDVWHPAENEDELEPKTTTLDS